MEENELELWIENKEVITLMQDPQLNQEVLTLLKQKIKNLSAFGQAPLKIMDLLYTQVITLDFTEEFIVGVGESWRRNVSYILYSYTYIAWALLNYQNHSLEDALIKTLIDLGPLFNRNRLVLTQKDLVFDNRDELLIRLETELFEVYLFMSVLLEEGFEFSGKTFHYDCEHDPQGNKKHSLNIKNEFEQLKSIVDYDLSPEELSLVDCEIKKRMEERRHAI